jgi:hypothetical protein
MPSPFPGMDPFIEMFVWKDFHSRMITAAADALEVNLPERYVIRVERRAYVEHDSGDASLREPDIAIVDDQPELATARAHSTGASTAVVPVICELPMPQEHRESYLEIKDEESKEVVTVLEILSPNNKRPGSVGREEYLKKRESILRTRCNLVEIDLLRGGVRLPMASPLPSGDYFAIVSRARERPHAAVYGWKLDQRIPQIKVPVSSSDSDLDLDLQGVVDLVYRRARYRSLNYAADLSPPLDAEQRRWVDELLRGHRERDPRIS